MGELDADVWLPKDLDDPDFVNTSRVHDWRNHVGEHTEAIWHTFTREQKVALYRDANWRAGLEEWD
jgi:hypothetical protein